MIFKGLDFSIPSFWLFFAGLFAGFSLANFLRLILSKRKRREGGDSLHLLLAILYLTISIVLATLSFFIPDSKDLFEKGLFYIPLSALVLGFVCSLFKRVLGFPLFFLFILAYFFFHLSLKPWNCLPPQEEIATVRFLTVREGRLDLEVALKTGSTFFGMLPASEISAAVEIIPFSKLFFLRPARGMYRIPYLSGREEEKVLQLPQDGPDLLTRLNLPFFKPQILKTPLLLPKPLQRYNLVVKDSLETDFIPLQD